MLTVTCDCGNEVTSVGDKLRCEICGSDGVMVDAEIKWVKICKFCGLYTKDLFGLFVPHLCKSCYDGLRKEQIDKKEVCSLCKKPYIDCYC